MGILGNVIKNLVGGVIIYYIIKMALWIWAIVTLSMYWNSIQDWAKIIGIIGLIRLPKLASIFGSVITICAVYISKNNMANTVNNQTTTTPTPTPTPSSSVR